jgi:hypothetical protein
MQGDFMGWLDESAEAVRRHFAPELQSESVRPDLMRTKAELEDDLRERVMRNLYVVDVPRGADYYVAVWNVLKQKTLPAEYVSSPVWQHAHHLYWQIEALKGNPDATLWHPV